MDDLVAPSALRRGGSECNLVAGQLAAPYPALQLDFGHRKRRVHQQCGSELESEEQGEDSAGTHTVEPQGQRMRLPAVLRCRRRPSSRVVVGCRHIPLWFRIWIGPQSSAKTPQNRVAFKLLPTTPAS
jgi:hypothetical protein